jgi:hypothetical protein
LGVPNFFIDSFRIPPFLLPIYQAAGIQYDVPWQVLAAINEIETDYGRNLSISSAGAVGWMQFLPSTWKRWGVDANGDGVPDPYNPVDAIFEAARYLHAAGAAKDLGQAVFAYNHASWYVQSVLLRAKLIGGMPDQLLGALNGLVQGHFPVAAQERYADDSVERLATRRVKGANAAIPIGSSGAKGTDICQAERAGDRRQRRQDRRRRQLENVGAVCEAAGRDRERVHLRAPRDRPKRYPVPKPVRITAKDLTAELAAPVTQAISKLSGPLAPASAGTQTGASHVHGASVKTAATQERTPAAAVSSLKQLATPASSTAPSQPVGGLAKERLFARPARPASYAAGGALQLQSAGAEISNFRSYFSDVLHLARNQYTLQALKAGAIVVAGTILGRIAPPDRHHGVAHDVHDPARREERPPDRPQTHFGRVETVGGDRRLPGEQDRPVLRPRREEPLDRPSAPHVKGAAADPGAV